MTTPHGPDRKTIKYLRYKHAVRKRQSRGNVCHADRDDRGLLGSGAWGGPHTAHGLSILAPTEATFGAFVEGRHGLVGRTYLQPATLRGPR